jgi:hypothetical protein
MALKGNRRRNTTSLYLIESREAERILSEERERKKALAKKPAKTVNPNSVSKRAN